MPAITSLEDLRAAQEDLLGSDKFKEMFGKWHCIGWKNICSCGSKNATDNNLKGSGDKISEN
jgi:hypothetical protein